MIAKIKPNNRAVALLIKPNSAIIIIKKKIIFDIIVFISMLFIDTKLATKNNY